MKIGENREKPKLVRWGLGALSDVYFLIQHAPRENGRYRIAEHGA
jgi:hypothetical protein